MLGGKWPRIVGSLGPRNESHAAPWPSASQAEQSPCLADRDRGQARVDGGEDASEYGDLDVSAGITLAVVTRWQGPTEEGLATRSPQPVRRAPKPAIANRTHEVTVRLLWSFCQRRRQQLPDAGRQTSSAAQ